MTGDEALFSTLFRALTVLFSNGYNIETSKIIEATFLTLHFLPYAKFFAGQRVGPYGPSDPIVNTPVGGGNSVVTFAFTARYWNCAAELQQRVDRL